MIISTFKLCSTIPAEGGSLHLLTQRKGSIDVIVISCPDPIFVSDALSKISKDDHRIAIGLNDALKAAKIAAINYLLISDQAFSSNIEEKKIIHLLNLTETSGGKTYLVDSSTELGLQISSLSGILGILRFSINL